MNSPGNIEIFGSLIGLIIFGVLIFGIGGKFTRKTTYKSIDGTQKDSETSIESDGLITKISGFLHQKNNDELERIKTEAKIAFKELEIKNSLENNKFLSQDNQLIESLAPQNTVEVVEKKDDSGQQSFFDN